MDEVDMTAERRVKAKYPDARIYEGGDGAHVEIPGVPHPHFYGNIPINSWQEAAKWIDAKIEAGQ